MNRRPSQPPKARWLYWARNVSLRRVTTSARLIPQIDGLRFVAIFLVLVDHVLNQGRPFMHPGDVLAEIGQRSVGVHGVDLFFTLSGFVLALPFARHFLHGERPVNITAYFRRRLTRLEPPFVVAMFGRLILFLAFSSASIGVILPHFFAGLFYLHTFIYGLPSMVNLPSWSLEIEVQFYIVAPLLALLFRLNPTWLRRTIFIALIAATAFLAPFYHQRMALSLIGTLQFFLAGFLVCDLYVLRKSLPQLHWLWDIAGIASFSFALWTLGPGYWIALPVANILLCLAALFGRILPRFLALSFISIVGGMCYSIYLTHNSVFSAVHAGLIRIPALLSHPQAFNAVMFASAFIAALCVGTVFFVLIERPCMDPAWPSKLRARFARGR